MDTNTRITQENYIYTAAEKKGNVVNIMGDKTTNGWTCVSCCVDKADMKLLPCLHMSCVTCLNAAIDQGTSTSGEPVAITLYACPKCGHKVNISGMDDALDVFKNIPSFINRVHMTVGDLNAADTNTGVHKNGYTSDNGVCVCRDCSVTLPQSKSLHCGECNTTICTTCHTELHTKHPTTAVWDFIQNKVDYIQSLVSSIGKKMANHEEGIACVERVVDYLVTMKESIKRDVIQRADYLVTLVEQRKKSLLSELEDAFSAHMASYKIAEQRFSQELERFSFVMDFSSDLVNNGNDDDMWRFHSDVSNQCLHQLHQVPEAKVDVVSMKLDVPGKGKEHSTLEKLFGTLKEGTVLSGSAELVASFNVDMKWPTSIAVSSSKEVVVAGKSGSFDSGGKALFFDSRGRFHSKVNCDAQHVPLDVYPAGDGTVWLSNSAGELKNVSVAGRVLRTVPNVFQGLGHIGVLSDASLVIASAASREVKMLNELGQFIRGIRIPDISNHVESSADKQSSIKLTCLTTTSDDTIVIGDTESGSVIGFDLNGSIRFRYSDNSLTPVLKCPSALCCDPFDNILVADFTNDNIHLLSKGGDFLGCLLNRENGVSCPNCLALDSEGRLYVGQYGGDILMFSYMSCTQKV